MPSKSQVETFIPKARGRQFFRNLEQVFEISMPEFRMKEYFNSTPNWATGMDYMTISRTSEAPKKYTGFLTAKIYKESYLQTFMHLPAFLLNSEKRGSMTCKLMLADLFNSIRQNQNDEFPEIICFRTCNANVLSMMNSFKRFPGFDIYPNMDSGQNNTKLKKVAAKIAKVIAGSHEFFPDTGVIKNIAKPPDFYSKFPLGGSHEVRNYLQEHLSLSDRILVVCRMSEQKGIQRALDRLHRTKLRNNS